MDPTRLTSWLLSDLSLFPPEVSKALPPAAAHPETVNSGHPPAQLLTQLYQDKLHSNYKKVTHGVTFFRKLDPQRAYAACPNLKAMLDEMLAFAKAAGL